MSEKNAKQERKKFNVLSPSGKDIDPNEVAKEMAKSIGKMYEDRDKKAMGAKEHLIAQLKLMAEKYITANGVMSALDTVRTVYGEVATNGIYPEIQMSQRLAKKLSVVATKMAEKAKELDPEDMSELCDSFYKADIVNSSIGPEDLAEQLMILQLCQNIGPNASDVSDFCGRADEEIDKARADLVDYCESNRLNFNELCGPHDNCPTCLCVLCTNDCKEGKEISDGQSALDVCKDFIIEGNKE